MTIRAIPRTLPYSGFQSDFGLIPGWCNRLANHPPGLYKLGRALHGVRPRYQYSHFTMLRKSIIHPNNCCQTISACSCQQVSQKTHQKENGYAILAGFSYINLIAHRFPLIQQKFAEIANLQCPDSFQPEPPAMLDIKV